MNDFLNREVSIFPYKESHNPKQGILADFLLMCAKSEMRIEKIRSEQDENKFKKLKSKLPCCTISGLFHGGHKAENLIKHSGLICIDIDNCDPNKVMKQLKQLNIVLYASRSASGKGLFAVIPLAYPEKHREQFDALKKLFERMGIEVDKGCNEMPRLRYLSYDDKAFIRPNAVEFKGIYADVETKTKKNVEYNLFNPSFGSESTRPFDTDSDEYKSALRRTKVCVEEIENKNINIADAESDWFRLANSFSSLGDDLKDETGKVIEERGRSLFHRISKISSKYKFWENEKLFNRVLRDNKGITIATFFDICSQYGINGKVIEREREIEEFKSAVMEGESRG